MVIWIIGLSGSGKTYLSKKIYKKITGKKIHLDGDIVRKYLTYNLKYTLKDRERNSLFISDLCKFLESEGFTVVCSILSIFRNHQKNNRLKFNSYFQIYLKTDLKNLKLRNNKNIYSQKKNVVGEEIKFPKPYKNDLIINNSFKPYSKKLIEAILKKINAKNNKK